MLPEPWVLRWQGRRDRAGEPSARSSSIKVSCYQRFSIGCLPFISKKFTSNPSESLVMWPKFGVGLCPHDPMKAFVPFQLCVVFFGILHLLCVLALQYSAPFLIGTCEMQLGCLWCFYLRKAWSKSEFIFLLKTICWALSIGRHLHIYKHKREFWVQGVHMVEDSTVGSLLLHIVVNPKGNVTTGSVDRGRPGWQSVQDGGVRNDQTWKWCLLFPEMKFLSPERILFVNTW